MIAEEKHEQEIKRLEEQIGKLEEKLQKCNESLEQAAYYNNLLKDTILRMAMREAGVLTK